MTKTEIKDVLMVMRRSQEPLLVKAGVFKATLSTFTDVSS